MMADDMGYSDVGCYGAEIDTPNLDALGTNGLRSTGFTNNARCCPTRASLLTGLYPTQAGVGYMTKDLGFPGYEGRLGLRCVTLGEVLAAAGYRTAYSGKWHVARFEGDILPSTRGFQQSYTLRGGDNYFRPRQIVGHEDIGVPDDPDFYETDAIADHAATSIREMVESGSPFLSFVSFTAPHWPLHARPEDIARYRGRYDGGWERLRAERFERQQRVGVVPGVRSLPPLPPRARRWRDADEQRWEARRMEVYAAQVTAMDAAIGRIVRTLDDMGVRKNTLVLFLSDNGGSAEEMTAEASRKEVASVGGPLRAGNYPSIDPGPGDTWISYGRDWANASNTPYSKFKHWTHQGGTATPAVLSWPGTIAPGQIDHRPLHVMDVMPTLVQLGNASYPAHRNGVLVHPQEGESFASILTSKAGSVPWDEKRMIFYEHEGHRAVRMGNWKLVSDYPGGWTLHDLAADGAEQRDIVTQHPNRAETMAVAWQSWKQRVGVRTWHRGRQYG